MIGSDLYSCSAEEGSRRGSFGVGRCSVGASWALGRGRLRGRLMFDITKEDLIDLLREIDSGKIQLPEFQRSYVGNDPDVRSLIASVAKGYPVGALLTLQSGGEVKFKPRLIEGVLPKSEEPSELLPRRATANDVAVPGCLFEGARAHAYGQEGKPEAFAPRAPTGRFDTSPRRREPKASCPATKRCADTKRRWTRRAAGVRER
jgi:hypothetical protein